MNNNEGSALNTLRVYVAGPYSATSVIDALGNMKRGIALSVRAMHAGVAVYSPWCDFQFGLVADTPDDLTLEQYQMNSLAWLRVSDAVLLAPGWRDSRGTMTEVKLASELGIPVFETLDDLTSWAHAHAFGVTGC